MSHDILANRLLNGSRVCSVSSALRRNNWRPRICNLLSDGRLKSWSVQGLRRIWRQNFWLLIIYYGMPIPIGLMGTESRIDSTFCNILTKTPNPLLIQHLNKLVILNLSGCSKLKSFPNISSAGNIEKIPLKGTAIEELHSFIECLFRLFCVDLEDWKRLGSLPNGVFKLKSLKVLNLNGCWNQRLPEELGNLEASNSLYAEGTAITDVPSSIVPTNVHQPNLQRPS